MNVRRCTIALFLSAIVVLSLAGCDQVSVATPQPVTLTIGGSTAMQPVLAALADAFNQEHPNVIFDIRGGGSTIGEDRARNRKIDMAASTLLPASMRTNARAADDPLDGAADNRANADAVNPLVHTPIGLDSVAVIVNKQNPVESLTILALRDLFSGRTLDWPSVGGLGDEVLLVSREDGSGTRALFEERIMGDEAVSLTAVVMPSSADVVDYVATQPLAIGYVSAAYVAASAGDADADADADAGNFNTDDASDDVHIVAIEGRSPGADLTGDQPYFLTRPLFLATRGEPTGWTRQFIDFVLGPSGQEIVDQYHTRVR